MCNSNYVCVGEPLLSELHPDKEACEKSLAEKNRIIEATTKIPEPMVTGNETIAIVKHELMEIQIYDIKYEVGVEFAIRNISNSRIATLVFEATFYGKAGNILGTTMHTETDLRPGISRGIRINANVQIDGIVKSYNVKIIKMITTDIEKVQLRRQELNKIETGELEITGAIKNISEIKTDTAIVATFSGSQQELLGIKIILLRNLNPDKIRTFKFKFRPQEDTNVKNYNLTIVNDIEEMTGEIK